MRTQIQIYPDPSVQENEKGALFETLLRAIMETQRFRVTERVNFTGTEIDLLCEHLDRTNERVLVECKARTSLVAGDIKDFVFDIVAAKRADYGYFVHTSELQHQAAGLAREMANEHSNLKFWGPDKVIELLQHAQLVSPPTSFVGTNSLLPTKRILLYTYKGHFWLTIFSNGVIPTHYHIVDAASPTKRVEIDVIDWLLVNVDDVKELSRYEEHRSPEIISSPITFDAVADIQEAEDWDDYRPVGNRYFVGRKDIRSELYQFVKSPVNGVSSRRVFFIEGKTGWGKSSLLAELRSRSIDQRNRTQFFVSVVDSRSASTGAFVGLALARLVAKAVAEGFVPADYQKVNITSNSDTLASQEMQDLLTWLTRNRRILVLIFDQFEDVFRKESLFRTFHKLMLDVHDQQRALIIGFSWKSEIFIPIDNPAYSLWQQARDLAQTFRLEQFLGSEVDLVISQLENQSGTQLPVDLKRRLKEGSQGFPWLTKKLAIHCYRKIKGGMTPEELVDRNLNVDDLFNEDTESLAPEEVRALRLIARRGYEGDPFDVGEIDDKAQESVINSLRDKRLIVRTGSKYSVYWDIFRDFLVEDHIPPLGESFLLRQYPQPCVRTLEFLLDHEHCTIDDISTGTDAEEGTALNRVRELRNLGVVTKVGEEYQVRSTIIDIDSFKEYMRDRLSAHVVVRALLKLATDTITNDHVVYALRERFRGYGFSDKTWQTYADYLIAWMHYADVELSNSIARAYGPSASRLIPVGFFLPSAYMKQLISGIELFKSVELVKKSELGANDIAVDLVALGLVTNRSRRHSYLEITDLGKSFLTNTMARPRIIRTFLEALPYIEDYLQIITASPQHHTDVLQSIIGDVGFTEETLKWRSKVLANWLMFSGLVFRKQGMVQLSRQDSLF